MTIPGTVGVIFIMVAMLVLSGCLQPGTTVSPARVHGTENLTHDTPSLPVPQSGPESPRATPTGISAVTRTAASSSTTPPPKLNGYEKYVRYNGPDYSVDYPEGWKTNVTILPLREYKHTFIGCSVTLAWQLDSEYRTWYSGDGSTLFSSSIVGTQRDIWPRNINRQINYADIANSILGNPDTCANTPTESFTISGITDVPLEGVSYSGVRVDFGRINATGFTKGTGSSYIVTGKNRRGVFTFYSTLPENGLTDTVSRHIFNSLRLDSGF
ncbi:MAG: hypothetical protein WC586_10390 [Methanoregula sp.]